jgi:hypothetical protein
MLKKFIAGIALCALVIPYSATAQEVVKPQVGLSKDVIYFVFPDRYRNGDASNDLAKEWVVPVKQLVKDKKVKVTDTAGSY